MGIGYYELYASLEGLRTPEGGVSKGNSKENSKESSPLSSAPTKGSPFCSSAKQGGEGGVSALRQASAEAHAMVAEARALLDEMAQGGEEGDHDSERSDQDGGGVAHANGKGDGAGPAAASPGSDDLLVHVEKGGEAAASPAAAAAKGLRRRGGATSGSSTQLGPEQKGEEEGATIAARTRSRRTARV